MADSSRKPEELVSETLNKTPMPAPLSKGMLVLRALCYVFAASGGIVILLVSLLVTYSVVARNLGLGGVSGDFELVELVCAASASLFLPLCQFNKGHVMVDLFTSGMRKTNQQRLDRFWALLFACAWAVLCWRLFIGLLEVHEYDDHTMLLRVPLWWIFVPAVLGSGLSCVVALALSFSGKQNSQGAAQ